MRKRRLSAIIIDLAILVLLMTPLLITSCFIENRIWGEENVLELFLHK
jgi:hypothetical protein